MAKDDPGKPSLATSSLCVVIPLRKGSKGCPHKAIRPFAGSTLLEFAIRDALALDPARVVVTTDYDVGELPLAAQSHYEHRPAHLCKDDSPMSLVLKYVARAMHPSDILLLMQPNCFHPERVRLAQRVIKERAAGTSVKYPDFWHPAYALGGKTPKFRQGLEPAYRPDGLIYRLPVSHLMMVNPFSGSYVPVAGTANVDTESDWKALRVRYDDDYWGD
jgi:CMP-N-acetylneuraminic acid synthetase